MIPIYSLAVLALAVAVEWFFNTVKLQKCIVDFKTSLKFTSAWDFSPGITTFSTIYHPGMMNNCHIF